MMTCRWWLGGQAFGGDEGGEAVEGWGLDGRGKTDGAARGVVQRSTEQSTAVW